MGLTLDLSVHVLAFTDEPDVLLSGLRVQISLLALLLLELPDALLQPAQLRPVQHQCWAQIRRQRAISNKLNLGDKGEERKGVEGKGKVCVLQGFTKDASRGVQGCPY